MAQLQRKRIRIQADNRSFSQSVDLITGATPVFWRGNDVQFEIGIYEDDVFIDDIGNITSLTVEIKAEQDPESDTLMSNTIAYVDMDDSLVEEDWLAGEADNCHAKAVFTQYESDIAPGTYWIAVSVLTSDTPVRRLTLSAGRIEIREDATPPGTDGPIMGGNIVPSMAAYDGVTGEYTLNVTADRYYTVAFGANDTDIENGLSTITTDGNFITQGSTILLNGDPGELVTDVIRTQPFLTADESDARYYTAKNSYEEISVSAVGNSDVTRVANRGTHVANVTVGAGAGSYTRTLSVLVALGNEGDITEIYLAMPTSANPTIEIRNASAAGTLLSTIAGATDGVDVLVRLAYTGSAWILVSHEYVE